MIRSLLLAVSLLLCGCQTVGGAGGVRILFTDKNAQGTPNKSSLPLRNGQVILTESPEPTSFLFMLLPERFYPFTHGGVVAIEDGTPVVYEISGELATLPVHERLLDNVTGKAHRRDFFEYVSGNLYAEVFDVEPGVDGDKVVAQARHFFEAGTKFDPFYNFNDHQTLFCTEMVELSLRAGGATPREPEALNQQPSLLKSLEWLGVLPNRALPVHYYASPSRLTMAMGKFRTRAAAYAYFEAKREIFRRFRRPDQRLGFLFSLSDKGQLDLRPHIFEFTRQSALLFDESDLPPDDPRIAQAVRELAVKLWGPFEEQPVARLPFTRPFPARPVRPRGRAPGPRARPRARGGHRGRAGHRGPHRTGPRRRAPGA